MGKDIITFLTNSIFDSQSVIKATDTKLGFLVVGLSLPFSKLGKILNHISLFLDKGGSLPHFLSLIITIFFIGTWLVSFFVAIKGIIAIGNPAINIINDCNSCGVFFSGDIFKYKFKDIFLNDKLNKSKLRLSEQIKRLPKTPENIIEELTLEQMKIAYIRDLKFYRLKNSFYFACVFVGIGMLIYLYN